MEGTLEYNAVSIRVGEVTIEDVCIALDDNNECSKDMRTASPGTYKFALYGGTPNSDDLEWPITS